MSHQQNTNIQTTEQLILDQMQGVCGDVFFQTGSVISKFVPELYNFFSPKQITSAAGSIYDMDFKEDNVVSILRLNDAIVSMPNHKLNKLKHLKELYLENFTGDIRSWCKNLRVLHANEIAVGSLHLSECTGLQDLQLNSYIGDIECLSGLTSLMTLKIGSYTGDSLDDLAALANLTSLDLTSYNNDIKSLSGLVSLTSLDLPSYKGDSIDALSTLVSLTSLSLEFYDGDSIDALSTLASLTSLNLDHYKGDSIDVLSTLSSLTSLNLDYYEGDSIDALSPLVNLIKLDLDGYTGNDISVVSNFPKLEVLKLGCYYEEKGIGAISTCTRLKTLHIDHFFDFSILENLINLEEFIISIFVPTDTCNIDVFENLTSLKVLWLGDYYGEIDKLSKCTLLEELQYDGDESIQVIYNFPNLTNLKLPGYTGNIDIISSCTLLKVLVLDSFSRHRWSALVPIGKCTELEHLSLRQFISESKNPLFPLANCKKLVHLNLCDYENPGRYGGRNGCDPLMPLSELTSLMYLNLSSYKSRDVKALDYLPDNEGIVLVTNPYTSDGLHLMNRQRTFWGSDDVW